MKIDARLFSVFCLALLVQVLPAQQQPPLLNYIRPDAPVLQLQEGKSLTFSAQFSDDKDTDLAQRGMSNVVWRVDGVTVLETTNGAPGPVTSRFVFNTDYSMTTNGGFREFEIRTAGADLQGSITEYACRVRVYNGLEPQRISFGPLPEKTLGDADFSPDATASSGLPVSYTSSNPDVAQIMDGMVHLVGAGVTCIEARQAGNSDFHAAGPVCVWLTVRACLSADVSGSGAVTGTGLYMPGAEIELNAVPADGSYFQRWENGSHALSRRLVMPATNVHVSATFSTEVPAPELGAIVPPRGMVGVGFSASVPILSDCRPSVRVSGLPQGLAYNSAASAIEGVPRAACSNRLVTVTVTNPLGASVSQRFSLTVEPLPSWVRGSFSGYMGAFGGHTGGLASMRIAEDGKVSGKILFGDTTVPFSSDRLSFSSGLDDDYPHKPYYRLWLPFKDGTTEGAFEMAIVQLDLSPWLGAPYPPVGYVGALVLRYDVSGAWFVVGNCELYQSASQGQPVTTLLGERYAGYYTATLDGCAEYGSGYLALTVDKRGGVKTAGKLADGTAVSLSGKLVLDDDGRVWSVLFAAPASYKGGAFFCVAEWVKPDAGPAFMKVLDGPAEWTSRNPRATAEYGAGFSRVTGLTGGWYDKVGNLYDHYRGKMLSFTTDSEARNPVVQVGDNAHEALFWRPDGLPISVVLNSGGRMTGLASPQRTPLLATEDQLGSNPIQLTVALNRATGIFRGSFNAWFNTWPYDEDAEYFSKRVSFGGVLTPERRDKTDGGEGRGYFLWDGQGQRAGTSVLPSKYSVRESYDLRLLSQPAD